MLMNNHRQFEGIVKVYVSALIGVFFIAYRVVSFTFFPYYSVMSKKEVH